MGNICKVENCENITYSKELCGKHYQRNRINGTTDRIKHIAWNKYYSNEPCYACGSSTTLKSRLREVWYPNHDIDKNRICNVCYNHIWNKIETGKISKRKLKIINHYSNGLNECVCCGVNFMEFLSVDHINNDGAEHRKKVKNLYAWIIRNKFPKGFQVLCMNCNTAKGHYKKCPHEDYVGYEQWYEGDTGE